MNFGYTFHIRSPSGNTPGPRMGKHHGKYHLPAGKQHASEGRRSPKIAPPKMPNVTSETDRTVAANTMEKITSWQGNTMPLKDGEAPKLHPENV